jgi:oligoendopeptidase F
MLRSGASDHPIELLRRAGVDLADPKSLEALVGEMDRLVNRLETELESVERG